MTAETKGDQPEKQPSVPSRAVPRLSLKPDSSDKQSRDQERREQERIAEVARRLTELREKARDLRSELRETEREISFWETELGNITGEKVSGAWTTEIKPSIKNKTYGPYTVLRWTGRDGAVHQRRINSPGAKHDKRGKKN